MFLNNPHSRKKSQWAADQRGVGCFRDRPGGDEAICEVANILNAAVRKSDFVIRYGGDEFLVALTQVTGSTVQEVAERIRQQIYDARLDESLKVRMTTSIGAVHYQPDSGDSLDANWLIDHVGKAMYEAKREGGNQVWLYHVQGADNAGGRCEVTTT